MISSRVYDPQASGIPPALEATIAIIVVAGNVPSPPRPQSGLRIADPAHGHNQVLRASIVGQAGLIHVALRFVDAKCPPNRNLDFAGRISDGIGILIGQ